MARILIAANSTWNIKNFRLGLTKALLRAGHDVVTVTPDDDGIEVAEGAVRHRKCQMTRASINPFAELPVLSCLFRLILEERPDVFLSFTIKPNIYGCSLCRLVDIPCIPNVSGLGTAFLGHTLLRWVTTSMYRVAFSRAQPVFFQNPDDRDLFINRHIIRRNQAKLLPGSGVDVNYFRSADLPPEKRFLMISRLLGDKGVREYVEAARALSRRIPDTKFALVGQLDEANPTAIQKNELSQWIEEGLIEYLGSAADIRPLIRKSAAVVLPSYREGLPRSLLEAAAMGRPLIGTDVPGCRELVREGVTGFLCEARNADSLTDAMERLASSPRSVWTRMGAAARAMVEREFDEALVIGAYLEVIEQIR